MAAGTEPAARIIRSASNSSSPARKVWGPVSTASARTRSAPWPATRFSTPLRSCLTTLSLRFAIFLYWKEYSPSVMPSALAPLSC